MLNLLFRTLLTPVPKLEYGEEESAAYERLLAGMADGRVLDYDLPFPKARFLQYVAEKGDYLFHGSNNPNIAVFEPREQTLYNGELTRAIFAAGEPLWSMFYAVFDRSKLVGGFRNGCFVVGNRKYLFYSLNESTMKQNPWTDGMMYLLPKSSFYRADTKKIHFDEWVTHEEVAPVAKLPLSPDDFPFKDRVAMHKDGEPLWKSWSLYKIRSRQSINMDSDREGASASP